MHRHIVIAAVVCLGFYTSCRHHNNHDIKVSINESGGNYTFYASFPEQKTNKIHRLINNRISPNGLFASAEDHLNVTTTLQDKTTFAVKASPGIVEIRVNREGNSPAAFNCIKYMCTDIRNALKD